MEGDEIGEETLELSIVEVEEGPAEPEGYRPIVVQTSRGIIELLLYAAPAARAGVVWMGGAGGGFDTPAQGLYPRLCEELLAQGVSSVRLQFRHPNLLPEAVLDAVVAGHLLVSLGCERLAFVGHSFGGAVAIQAATHSSKARTVVTLASQSYGAAPAAEFSDDRSILVVHGTEDEILPPTSSEHIHRIAGGRKRLVLLDGARHGLDEAADELGPLVRDWLVRELARAPGAA